MMLPLVRRSVLALTGVMFVLVAAVALSTDAAGTYTARELPFQSIELSADATKVSFDLNARRWICDVLGTRCADTGAATGRPETAGGGRGAGGRGGGRGGAAAVAVPSPDGSEFAFISTSRDHKEAVLRVADPATGTIRTVLQEKVATQYESRVGCRVLWDTNEVVWYSERDNWGHLYLYDFKLGALKNQITSGDGPVMQMVRLDEKTRTVWFQAQGREKGEDPYFRHVYRIGLDGKGYASLTPVVGDHAVQLSPSGRYLVDTYSQPIGVAQARLQRVLEGAEAWPVAAAAVGQHQEFRHPRVAVASLDFPPPDDILRRERRRVVRSADEDRPAVGPDVVDAEGGRHPDGVGPEVVVRHELWSLAPGRPRVFEVADQLLLLGVDVRGSAQEWVLSIAGEPV